MTNTSLVSLRLQQQQISRRECTRPEQLVEYLVAMQAQEYAMAKWAIGLRLTESTDASVEKAFNDGAILRTHLMRPTWHFVAPADIRWLLMLTAPRVKMINGFIYRQQQLDASIFKKSHAAIEKALEGGKFLTRKALQDALKKKKIIADGVKLSALMMEAELDGLICSGPRQGKQFTYALLEERVPPVKKLKRDEALAQFGLRYFSTRGPASIQDFAYWSGLTLKDAKDAAASLPSKFITEKVDGIEYIIDSSLSSAKISASASFLMPVYDEFGMSYKNRSAILNPATGSKEYLTFNNLFIIRGKICGGWKRSERGKGMSIETTPFVKLNPQQTKELANAVSRFKKFTGH
ncbi:MAG: winged helix DNA-binding domain-containing protein [Citrobacter freundii]|nr:MAG: winged helix DNA-binding domain-containing protein [Citrobacter freundii]